MLPGQIEDGFNAAPQLTASDFEMLAEQGVKTIVNNRPDSEFGVTVNNQMAAELCRKYGMEYHFLPLGNAGLTMDLINQMADILANAPRPIVSYCASGARSASFWAIASAVTKTPDEIISAGAASGHNFAPMRPILTQIASSV